jgi:hypothetical protein
LEVLQEQIFTKKLSELRGENFQVQAVTNQPILALTQEEIELAKQQAEKLIKQQLIFSYEYQKFGWTINNC